MDVCLLHGFAQTPSAWDDVRVALGPLASEAVPTPGHDPSLPVRAGWDEAIADLAARLPSGAVVVGYSFGARLALGLLAIDAVRAAVLIGVNPGLRDDVARAARRADDGRWADRLRALGTPAFLDAWEAQPLFATQARAPDERRARRRQARQALAAAPLATALEVLGLGAMPDLEPALVARAPRAHLIVGGDDARFVALAAGLRARSPDLLGDVIAGSGHDPTLEAPDALATVLAGAIARFR
jgi:2-succinyl-6-hydroxy-2,4-cyclohexadiene-1-carboxylate synthase